MAPKPPHGDDPLVYPVEFEGYPGTDDSGISVRHVNVRVNGLRWCAYNLQSVRKVKRLGQPLNQAEKHKTQRVRYFYNKDEALEYFRVRLAELELENGALREHITRLTVKPENSGPSS